jgi:uncharacterized SAM-binding protein YcdF (DUF218 family)
VTLLTAAAFFLRRKARLQSILLWSILGIIFITGNSWVALGLARSLEWQHFPPGTIPETEVIVVLGGGTYPQQYPRPTIEVNNAGDRILYAANLYHAGKATHLLLSGGGITWQDSRQMSIAEEMAVLAGWMNVPEEALWLQEESRNTYEDALYSAEMLEEKGINQIVLVTSAMHMPRSVALFEAQGLEVIPAPTDFVVTEVGWENITSFNPQAILTSLTPTVGNMGLTTATLKEYLGMLVYSLRGWI